MQTMEELQEAMRNVADTIGEVEDDLATWIDLDGETDADSREQRRDAREAIENGLDELESVVRDLASLFGGKS